MDSPNPIIYHPDNTEDYPDFPTELPDGYRWATLSQCVLASEKGDYRGFIYVRTIDGTALAVEE